MDDLIDAATLAARLGEPGLHILDATYLPFERDRDAAAEYRAGHIPGARFLDLATLADPHAALPSTVPQPGWFARRMAALGVARDAEIILYDDAPHRTAARAWWLLRLFGARRVTILDGGLAAWRMAGLPLEAGEGDGRAIAPDATGFGDRDAAMLVTLAQMRGIVGGDSQVVDARSAARFTGAEADPRPGVAPGHMPGARNLPYTALFDGDGRWKRGAALVRAFADAGVDPARPMVTTCGSGITAADLTFAAHLLGNDDAALYDGSWSEWGADPAAPKVTG